VAKHNTAAGWSLMVANTTITMASRLSEKGTQFFLGFERLQQKAFHYFLQCLYFD